jgi:hypothetical protein
MSVGKPTANHRQAETHILPSSRKRHPGQVPSVSAGSFPHDTHNRLYLPCCPNYDRNRKLGHDNIADINTLTLLQAHVSVTARTEILFANFEGRESDIRALT